MPETSEDHRGRISRALLFVVSDHFRTFAVVSAIGYFLVGKWLYATGRFAIGNFRLGAWMSVIMLAAVAVGEIIQYRKKVKA